MQYEEVVETFGGGAWLEKVAHRGQMQSLKGTSGPSGHPSGLPCSEQLGISQPPNNSQMAMSQDLWSC